MNKVGWRGLLLSFKHLEATNDYGAVFDVPINIPGFFTIAWYWVPDCIVSHLSRGKWWNEAVCFKFLNMPKPSMMLDTFSTPGWMYWDVFKLGEYRTAACAVQGRYMDSVKSSHLFFKNTKASVTIDRSSQTLRFVRVIPRTKGTELDAYHGTLHARR